MWRRLAALALVLMMMAGTACAEVAWPGTLTAGQQLLKAYVARVNEDLAALGAAQVNRLFECYAGFASLGVASDDAEIPEGNELIVTMAGDTLETLTLRTNDADLFAVLAAACIQAASPDAVALTDTMAEPAAYAARVKNEPENSFSDEVNTAQSDRVRTYYAYEPNAYGDGENWLTMTLVFAWSGTMADGVYVTPTPLPPEDYGNEYEGTQFDDGYTHLEIFVTATPSPDDALI